MRNATFIRRLVSTITTFCILGYAMIVLLDKPKENLMCQKHHRHLGENCYFLISTHVSECLLSQIKKKKIINYVFDRNALNTVSNCVYFLSSQKCVGKTNINDFMHNFKKCMGIILLCLFAHTF